MHTTNEEPTRRRRGPARAGLAGVAIGMAGAVGAMALIAGTANAQSGDAPALDATDGGGAEAAEIVEVEPGEAYADDELDAFFVCVDEVIVEELPEGELPEGAVIVDGEEGDLDWEALEGELEACDDLLPAEILEMEEDYAAYEECLVDNGLDAVDPEEWEDGVELGDDIEYHEPASLVVVETPDGSTFVELGDGSGSVTVDFDGDDIDVSVEGDAVAETIEWDEIDHPAFEACADLEPQGFDIVVQDLIVPND